MNQIDSTSSSALLLGRYHKTLTLNANQKGLEKTRKSPPVQVPLGEELVASRNNAHILTIAPSLAGRSRACIIPNLLTYTGSVVVTDLTGEIYSATARARKELGQTIVRLDPFHVLESQSDSLNPFDLFQGVEGPTIESICHDIAGLLPNSSAHTDVWESIAHGLLCGVTGYIQAVPEKQKFSDLYNVIHSDDVVYNLAVVLDTIGKEIPKLSYTEIASFLQRADADRSRIINLVSSKLKAINTQEAQATVGPSTFSLQDFAQGKPFTIYISVPHAKLPAHCPLFRIWLGTLFHALMKQKNHTRTPTLFLLNECAKIGAFPQMEAALLSGPTIPLKVWTFWNDLEELKTTYPASWLLNNSEILQLFGVRNYAASSELAAFLGIEPEDIRWLTTDEQILCENGIANRFRLLDYLSDPVFAGLYDSTINPKS